MYARASDALHVWSPLLVKAASGVVVMLWPMWRPGKLEEMPDAGWCSAAEVMFHSRAHASVAARAVLWPPMLWPATATPCDQSTSGKAAEVSLRLHAMVLNVSP
jgi:hypothetical protein